MFFTISFLQAAVEEGSQGAIQTVRTHLYGEKLHSYKSTVKLGGFSPIAPFLPMLTRCICQPTITNNPEIITSLAFPVPWILL